MFTPCFVGTFAKPTGIICLWLFIHLSHMAIIGVAPSPYLFVGCCWCPRFPPADLFRWSGRASRWSDTATLGHDACLLDQLWNSHEIANHREDLTMKSWHSPAKMELRWDLPSNSMGGSNHQPTKVGRVPTKIWIRPWCLLTRFTSPPASIGQNRLEWQHTVQWFISHMLSCIWPSKISDHPDPARTWTGNGMDHPIREIWRANVFRMEVD